MGAELTIILSQMSARKTQSQNKIVGLMSRPTQTKQITSRNVQPSRMVLAGRRASSTDGVGSVPNKYLKIPRSLRIVPDRFYTKLSFIGSGSATITSPAVHTSFRYVPSSAYDVDPGLGSAAMPGYADLAALYGAYRVTVSQMEIEFSSTNNAYAVTAVLLPLNVDPGSAPTFTTVASWPGNPRSNYKLLPLLGGPTTIMKMKVSTEEMFGTKAVYFDPNWAAATNTTPNDNWYWAVGLISDSAPASPVKIGTMIRIDLGIEFYDRKVQEI
jgi:hypothetical protein